MTGSVIADPADYTHTHAAAPVPDTAQQEEAWPFLLILPAFKILEHHDNTGHSFTSLLSLISVFILRK